MSFAAKFINAEGGEVRVITATEAGKDAWFLLKITPENMWNIKPRFVLAVATYATMAIL